MANILFISVLLLCAVTSECIGGVLVSGAKLYPSHIKTPKDIENWLISEGFRYKADKTLRDEWKSPKQTVKDKGGDCEDFAVLVAHILEDLDYSNVMIIGIFGDSLAHAICWFQEKNERWSFFSIGSSKKTGITVYRPCKVKNPFSILYLYYPKWDKIKLCTENGIAFKTFYRKNLEKGIKK
jgi:hypothetical protein